MVKKQTGANESAIISAIEWMKTQFNMPNPEQPKPKPMPFQIYRRSGHSHYFDDVKWDKPVMKIKECFASQIESNAALKEALNDLSTFDSINQSLKNQLAAIVLKNAPIGKPMDLMACLDYIRALCLTEEGVSVVVEYGDSVINEILQKYFIQQNIPEQSNPRAARIMFWRLCANLMKFELGQNLLLSNYTEILEASIQTIRSFKDDENLLKAFTIALNNIIFSEFGLEMEDLTMLEIIQELSTLLKSNSEPVLVASLNIMCRLVDSEDRADYIKKNVPLKAPVLLTHLQTLRYRQNKDIGNFAEDLIRLLS